MPLSNRNAAKLMGQTLNSRSAPEELLAKSCQPVPKRHVHKSTISGGFVPFQLHITHPLYSTHQQNYCARPEFTFVPNSDAARPYKAISCSGPDRPRDIYGQEESAGRGGRGASFPQRDTAGHSAKETPSELVLIEIDGIPLACRTPNMTSNDHDASVGMVILFLGITSLVRVHCLWLIPNIFSHVMNWKDVELERFKRRRRSSTPHERLSGEVHGV